MEPDEHEVGEPIRARHAWLALTDRRFLVLDASARGHPRALRLVEPLGRVQVERHYLWSKLASGLLVRTADGRRARILLKGPGTRTRAGMDRALDHVEHDVELWTEVARIRADEAAAGHEVDPAYALARATARECLTPAQMARTFGLEPRHVADVLAERCGIRLSTGASRKYTYTARDLEVFDDDVKDRLFLALVEEHGSEAITAATQPGAEWWETSAGEGLETLLSLADVDAAHVSAHRTPFPRWQAWVMWFGLVGSLLLTIASAGILIFIPWTWRRSWEQWREGAVDRPRSAIRIGVAMLVLLMVGVGVGLLVAAGVI